MSRDRLDGRINFESCVFYVSSVCVWALDFIGFNGYEIGSDGLCENYEVRWKIMMICGMTRVVMVMA